MIKQSTMFKKLLCLIALCGMPMGLFGMKKSLPKAFAFSLVACKTNEARASQIPVIGEEGHADQSHVDEGYDDEDLCFESLCQTQSAERAAPWVRESPVGRGDMYSPRKTVSAPVTGNVTPLTGRISPLLLPGMVPEEEQMACEVFHLTTRVDSMEKTLKALVDSLNQANQAKCRQKPSRWKRLFGCCFPVSIQSEQLQVSMPSQDFQKQPSLDHAQESPVQQAAIEDLALRVAGTEGTVKALTDSIAQSK